MATTAVGPGQLAAAYAAATAGDVLVITGLQDFGTVSPFNIEKQLTFQNAAGQQATIRGRVVIWDGTSGHGNATGFVLDGQTTDPRSAGFILNGIFGTTGPASWIIRAQSTLKGFTLTNNYTNIGINLVNGTGTEIGYGIIHEIGVKGSNQDHGIYDSTISTNVHDMLIYDCAARAIQARGATTGNYHNNTCATNGECIIFDGAINCSHTKSIFAYKQVALRYLVEQVDSLGITSSGNTVIDNIIWDGAGVTFMQPGMVGVTVSNPGAVGQTQNENPLFNGPLAVYTGGGVGDYSLSQSSPVGYGASFLAAGSPGGYMQARTIGFH